MNITVQQYLLKWVVTYTKGTERVEKEFEYFDEASKFVEGTLLA